MKLIVHKADDIVLKGLRGEAINFKIADSSKINQIAGNLTFGAHIKRTATTVEDRPALLLRLVSDRRSQ